MNKYITFDIGGTFIKYGIIQENGELIYSSKMETEIQKGGPNIVNKLLKKINELRQSYNVNGVAISSAGVINSKTGIVVNATKNIPNFIGLNYKETIEKATNLPVEVQNDVNCFALCEKWLGNARDCNNFITLTIGTGIGGAIYINDNMYYGNNFSAGEWGRMNILGEKYEAVSSITGLTNLAKKYVEDKVWDGKEIFDLYDQGDKAMTKVINKFYKHLVTGICNLIYIFNPDKVIIGGGITSRGNKFIEEVNEHLSKVIEKEFLETTEISLSKFSNNSGMIGALYHFLQNRGL